jgi:hypothetical protein
MNFVATSSKGTKDNTRQNEFSSPPTALRQCLGSFIRCVRNYTHLKMEWKQRNVSIPIERSIRSRIVQKQDKNSRIKYRKCRMDRIHYKGNRMYRNLRRNGKWIQIQVTKLLNFSAPFLAFAVPREMYDTVNIWARRRRTLDNQFHRTELGLRCSSWCCCIEKLGKARILTMIQHKVKNYTFTT